VGDVNVNGNVNEFVLWQSNSRFSTNSVEENTWQAGAPNPTSPSEGSEVWTLDKKVLGPPLWYVTGRLGLCGHGEVKVRVG